MAQVPSLVIGDKVFTQSVSKCHDRLINRVHLFTVNFVDSNNGISGRSLPYQTSTTRRHL